MCTAATYQTKDFYFGRTLDYDVSYGNRVVLTPRGFTFRLRNGKTMSAHYAMLGMACENGTSVRFSLCKSRRTSATVAQEPRSHGISSNWAILSFPSTGLP